MPSNSWYLWKLDIPVLCSICKGRIHKAQRVRDVFDVFGQYVGTAHLECIKVEGIKRGEKAKKEKAEMKENE